MKNKSKKVIETEQWVDAYISKNGKPPTYAEIQKQFNLSAAAAHARCKKFREKMNVNEKKVDGVWIKFDRFFLLQCATLRHRDKNHENKG